MNRVIIQRLAHLAPNEGFNKTFIENVLLYRTESPIQGTIFMYDPCVVFVAQRRKIGHVGGKTFVYDPGHYLVVPTLLPFECDAEGSPDEPFLAMSIPLEFKTMAELISHIQIPESPSTDYGLPIYSDEITGELVEAILRLLNCLDSSEESALLGPQIIREIIYRVLKGPKAYLLFDIFSSNTNRIKIKRSLRHIHENFQMKLGVESLAQMEGMSVSSFHAQFKKVTSKSPLQYIKSIRLNRARDLITFEGFSISAAAYSVGYESVSQFSREFKSYFGHIAKDSKLYYPIRKAG